MASQLWRRSIAIVEKNQLRRVWHYAGVACDGYYKYYCVEWQTASEHRASDLIINERRWWAEGQMKSIRLLSVSETFQREFEFISLSFTLECRRPRARSFLPAAASQCNAQKRRVDIKFHKTQLFYFQFQLHTIMCTHFSWIFIFCKKCTVGRVASACVWLCQFQIASDMKCRKNDFLILNFFSTADLSDLLTWVD